MSETMPDYKLRYKIFKFIILLLIIFIYFFIYFKGIEKKMNVETSSTTDVKVFLSAKR